MALFWLFLGWLAVAAILAIQAIMFLCLLALGVTFGLSVWQAGLAALGLISAFTMWNLWDFRP